MWPGVHEECEECTSLRAALIAYSTSTSAKEAQQEERAIIATMDAYKLYGDVHKLHASDIIYEWLNHIIYESLGQQWYESYPKPPPPPPPPLGMIGTSVAKLGVIRWYSTYAHVCGVYLPKSFGDVIVPCRERQDVFNEYSNGFGACACSYKYFCRVLDNAVELAHIYIHQPYSV